jgi:hypothetical protein
MLCRAALCRAVPRCVVLCRAVSCCAALCCAVQSVAEGAVGPLGQTYAVNIFNLVAKIKLQQLNRVLLDK